MPRFDAQKALIAYSGVLTAILGWTMLTGAAADGHARFDTIDVHRVNVTETDGTLRMVMAGKDRFPGLVFHGRERPHAGRADVAGMLFFNDEATENGGLIFGGRKKAGKVTNFGHLSFDQYEQDQVINLEQTEENGERYGGLSISDYPDAPIDFALADRLANLPAAERQQIIEQKREAGELGRRRLFVGKTAERDAVLALRDGKGRIRLRLRVGMEGDAAIEFLDEAGKVVKTDRPAA